MRIHHRPLRFICLFVLFPMVAFAACKNNDRPEETSAPSSVPTTAPLFTSPTETPSNSEAPGRNTPDAGESPTLDFAHINISSANEQPFDRRLLGTNVPAWLSSSRLEDPHFQERALAAGLDVVRIPGGSWSNYYNWLACEQDGDGIDEQAECYWPWAARPSDFIRFVETMPAEVMYTVNANGTAQEAAALVAFLNGSTSDDSVIGSDILGRDWGTVGQWAELRQEVGFDDPIGVTYWEIGNEIYGGNAESGTDCTSIGWEDTWTCDGVEYINGIEGRDGFRDFYDAMKAVDSSIQIGAVGIPLQDEWSNWGNEVLSEAGMMMDFYIIHHYPFFNLPNDYESILAAPQENWPVIMRDFSLALDRFTDGRDIPVAVTEYNLVAFQDLDENAMMTRTINALFIADTIGQLMVNGVDMANHWALANGRPENGTDYGLVDSEDYALSPQYFAFYLWSKFGAGWLPVDSSYRAATTLSVYAGRHEDGSYSLLAINKSGDPIAAPILLDGEERAWNGSASVMRGDSLESQQVIFNGVIDPSGDPSDKPAQALENVTEYTFAPYSITLLHLEE